ncbi:hypothetical protein [Rhodanobacter sp. L36]|uniref:hypothetical protein n=1 Tax=Rhodanobacter sp. L36 TaxID=1747221 RepID=UPI00131D72D9|nr:hypothetical protein [Rhodanobacter sp. L36]
MSNRKHVVIALGASLAVAGVVWACGPDFPNQLLDHRAATLKATPQNSFAFEAKHLLVATDTLQAHETGDANSGDAKPEDIAKAQGLTLQQEQRVDALRKLDDGDKAYDEGKDLPEDLRLYVAGAMDFSAANPACPASDPSAASAAPCAAPDASKLDRARARFEALLALPPDQAKLRSTWAAYMLGRIHAERAATSVTDDAAFKSERDASARMFQLARARAIAGASDTQGLAVASFGEEARLYLYNDQQACDWKKLYVDSDPCGKGISPADLKHAIALYAAQAGHGSDSAVNSLSTLAANVLRDEDRATALIDGPVSQRLLVSYALARMGGDGNTGVEAGDDTNKPVAPPPVLTVLVAAIEKQGLDRVAGADRLAALAYSVGRYDLATTLAAKAPGPLSSWVKAKLALQKGDLVAAAAAYADAAKAFPQANDPKPSIEPLNAELILGEQGVLAIGRGEYVDALGHLYDAANRVGGVGDVYDENGGTYGYSGDVSYIAERVLTIDELKAFIDAHVPASPAPAKSTDKDHAYGSPPLANNLRWLLARRLMRDGRYDEAQEYLPVSGDLRFGQVDLRAKAREYAKAMHDASSAWTDIGKAQARYSAAVIARENGMELFGFEQAPDYNALGGSLDGGVGQDAKSMSQTFVTDGERKRYADTVAKPDYRFHYRYLAADDATAAADLLPPRSQAFAAVMCKATGWMLEGPPDYNDHYQGYGEAASTAPSERERRITAYYQRYVTQGAHVAWADNFGSQCEAPDFDRARALLRHQRVLKARHLVRRYLSLEIGGLVLVVGVLVALVLRRRRRRVA